MFSSLADYYHKSEENLFSKTYEQMKKTRSDFIDFVQVDWYQQELRCEEAILREAYLYGLENSKSYHPSPLGNDSLRESIADWYSSKGFIVSPEQVVITPGTSLSYWAIFQLLANTNECILIPTPGYPLFDMIAKISRVELQPYPLEKINESFVYSFENIYDKLSAFSPKGICFVSPHNPTGCCIDELNWNEWVEVTQKLNVNVPLIVDEVFQSYRYAPEKAFSLITENLQRDWMNEQPLSFLLNGVSKLLGLPGHKIGWVIVCGEQYLVKQSLQALEFILDTFLPTQEVAQNAIDFLFRYEDGKWLQNSANEIALRVGQRKNYVKKWSEIHLDSKLVIPDHGVYAWLNLESNEDVDTEIIRILNQGVVMHPHYFYDIENPALLFTTLRQEIEMNDGLTRAFSYRGDFIG